MGAWMLPCATSRAEHVAHWVRTPGRPSVGDSTFWAVCRALVGPDYEVTPGQRCARYWNTMRDYERDEAQR